MPGWMTQPGPCVPGLRSAISRHRCPSPSSVAAIDHSDSPRVTVWARVGSAVAGADADVGMAWRAVVACSALTAAGRGWVVPVAQAGDAATAGAAATVGMTMVGPATNRRIAAPTRDRAADCGRARPGRCGAETPRTRASTSKVMVAARNAQASPRGDGQDAQGQRAVVARGQGGDDLVEGGRLVGDGVGADRDKGGRDGDQDGGDPEGGGEAEQAGADGVGHCSTPPTDRVMRAWPCPVTVIEVIPMIPRKVVG